jgi:hypothetical protein
MHKCAVDLPTKPVNSNLGADLDVIAKHNRDG